LGQLRVGLGEAIITPPVGKSIPLWRYRRGKSIGIHDHLLAKSIVLSDGNTDITLITLDIVLISNDSIEKIRRKIRKLTGIPEKNIMFNCSHNHTTPTPPTWDPTKGKIVKGPWPYLDYEEYMAFDDYVAGTVYQAYKNMQRAKFGIGKGKVDGITVNRRHPEYPVDTELNVIRIDKNNNFLMASLVNYQCHALCVGGQYLLWTADFPSFMREYIEKNYPGSSCLFLQGAAGDIHPWDWWLGNLNPRHMATFEEAKKFGRIIGSEACKILETIQTNSNVEIKVGIKKIKLKGRKFSWSLSEIEETIKEVLERDKPWRGKKWPKGVTVSNIYHKYPDGYRYGLIPFMKQVAELAKRGESMPDVEAELQAFKINDVILILTPGELFDKLGRKIKEDSPYNNTIVLSETTTHGYIPPLEAFKEVEKMSLREFIDPKSWWAYGATYTCYVAPGMGELVVEEALKLIKEL